MIRMFHLQLLHLKSVLSFLFYVNSLLQGHDTTTAGITWCLLLLGNHLDVQVK